MSVTLKLDSGVREVDVPPELADALVAAGLIDVFDAFSYSHRREWARSVADAKKDETRAKRIAFVIDAIRSSST